MLAPDPKKFIAFISPKDLYKWLQKNHDTATELWIKIFKIHTKIPSITWNEIVIETLRWGWIDGIKKSIDNTSYIQRITPRKEKSSWSKRNTEHVERLIKEGKMQESGLIPVLAAKADGRWDKAYTLSTKTKMSVILDPA